MKKIVQTLNLAFVTFKAFVQSYQLVKFFKTLLLCVIISTISCHSSDQTEIFGGLRLGVPGKEFRNLLNANNQFVKCNSMSGYCYIMGDNIKGNLFAFINSDNEPVNYVQLEFFNLENWELEYVKRIIFDKYHMDNFKYSLIENNAYTKCWTNPNFNNARIGICEGTSILKISFMIVSSKYDENKKIDENKKFERDKNNF